MFRQTLFHKTLNHTVNTNTLTNAGNTLHRDLADSLLEAGEARVHLPDLALFPLDELLDDLIAHIGRVYALCRASPPAIGLTAYRGG